MVSDKKINFEEEHLITELINRKVKSVLIQLPEGLRKDGPRLAALVEKIGVLAIVSADPCYGACDLALSSAECLNIDLIVHYGHSLMMQQTRIPTIYMDARIKVNIEETINEVIPLLNQWKEIGLLTTLQHSHVLDEARSLLNDKGKTIKIGEARGYMRYPGQITGCDFSTARSIADEVEAFLFIGGGKFHAIGAALSTCKPVVVADPFEKRSYSVDTSVKRILRRRWASIYEARKLHNFGVIVCLKLGQKKWGKAIEIKDKLEQKGRKATLLSVREIIPETLMQFSSIDAFVNTACPRVALDEPLKFPNPVLTVNETLVMLEEMDWETLCRNGLL